VKIIERNRKIPLLTKVALLLKTTSTLPLPKLLQRRVSSQTLMMNLLLRLKHLKNLEI